MYATEPKLKKSLTLLTPMDKTHRTAIVVIPPRDVWAPIQRIRQQHDAKIRRWMPHFTVIYPFCDESQFRCMARSVAEQSCRLKPFDVTLMDFDTFSHRKGRFTVWLRPEPASPLHELHAAVSKAVRYDRDYETRMKRFTPHLSVGQVRGRNHRDKLLAELAATWAPVRFPVTRVCFIARGDPPNDVFEVACSIPLGGGLTTWNPE